MPSVTLLLPERAQLRGGLLPVIGAALARADRETGEPGTDAQLARHLDILPRGWPVAAVTRQQDVGDAHLGAWLRADPAHVRAELNGARLLGFGDALRLTFEDTAALLPALKPVFGDAGFMLDAPVPSRWYVQLPREAKLPRFTAPQEALGADLFEHLPGSDDASPEARRWRALLTDAQVVLHTHPWNARREAAGKPAINSLWFWGGGVLPDHVATRYAQVCTPDTALAAFARAAGADAQELPPGWLLPHANCLYDLRWISAVEPLQEDWLPPMLSALCDGGVANAVLDCADGLQFQLAAAQRWRFWRRPLSTFAA